MSQPERKPEVILDIVFEDGLFFIVIKNIGDGPAYNVSTTFNKKLIGVEGTREISALPLFRNISFLAPGREIAAFLDRSASYFQRRQPTRIRASIRCRNKTGETIRSVIEHDLAIYKNLGYILPSTPPTQSPGSSRKGVSS